MYFIFVRKTLFSCIQGVCKIILLHASLFMVPYSSDLYFYLKALSYYMNLAPHFISNYKFIQLLSNLVAPFTLA